MKISVRQFHCVSRWDGEVVLCVLDTSGRIWLKPLCGDFDRWKPIELPDNPVPESLKSTDSEIVNQINEL